MVVGGKLFSYILMSHSVFSVLFIFMIHSDKRWTKPLEKNHKRCNQFIELSVYHFGPFFIEASVPCGPFWPTHDIKTNFKPALTEEVFAATVWRGDNFTLCYYAQPKKIRHTGVYYCLDFSLVSRTLGKLMLCPLSARVDHLKFLPHNALHITTKKCNFFVVGVQPHWQHVAFSSRACHLLYHAYCYML